MSAPAEASAPKQKPLRAEAFANVGGASRANQAGQFETFNVAGSNG